MEPSSLGDPVQKASLVRRYFTEKDVDPLDQVVWAIRTARAGDFVQEGVEAPDFWTDNSVGVVAKLYFATVGGVRETSVRQMIERVARKITDEGVKHGYFEPESFDLGGSEVSAWQSEQADIFYAELCYLLVHQIATFNSPVFFNVGVPGRRQLAHACYLLQPQDSMASITEWWATESRIFKSGGGSGADLSLIRASMELLSTGGVASGPLAYLRASNAVAETLKSGGSHRRSAKYINLDVDHPDIRDLINSKVREDERMRALMEAGFDLDPSTPEGERNIAETTSFQSSNNSVRVTDGFMYAVEDDADWNLIARTTGEPVGEPINARELMREIAEAAWRCADPGMMFYDTIQHWHTTPSVGPICSTNVCAEIVQPPNTSCNLGHINLLRILDSTGKVKIEDMRQAVDVMTLALDINCSYSEVGIISEEIERNTREMRHLGLGYTNLGAALMVNLLPYDSDEGRNWAASVTALMTGRAYRKSAEIAREMGAYARFGENRESHLAVIRRHLGAIPDDKRDDGGIWDAADFDWREAYSDGIEHGYRNALVTAIAPTGTTSFMMGADTFGIEPDFALVKYKELAAGGTMKIVNQAAEVALDRLGYSIGWARDTIERSVDKLMEGLATKHRPIFHCANDISAMGHLKMVAAVQPFVSQSISKTINLANSTTVEEIEDLYIEAWRRGCKVICVYRDGSKATQVLHHKQKSKIKVLPGTVPNRLRPEKRHVDEVELFSLETWKKKEPPPEVDDGSDSHEREERVQGDFTTSPLANNSERRHLPRDVPSTRHRMNVGGHKAYIHVGMYEDGSPGEIFVSSAGSEGSFVQGMWSALAKVTSLALQYGVPLEALVHQLANDEFEPKGATGNPDIPHAKSMVSYAFRWLASRFLDVGEHETMGILTPEVKALLTSRLDEQEHVIGTPGEPQFQNGWRNSTNGQHAYRPGAKPHLPGCGGLMTQTGACWTCQSCGENTGCG